MVNVRADGRVEFRFLSPGAGRVQIVGDFTNWATHPIEMTPEPDGWWKISVRLSVGEHRFRYLVDGKWQTDYAAFGVAANEFGEFDSIVVVDEPRVLLRPRAFAAA